MRRVVDASVAVKWFTPELNGEGDGAAAIALLRAVQRNEIEIFQPVHWKAEVLSVLARRLPHDIDASVVLLDSLDFQVSDSSKIYQTAIELAIRFQHHLFDTLYHAVALEHGAELVTADRKYYNKAMELGHISLLGHPG